MDDLLRKLEERVGVLKQRCEQLGRINTQLEKPQAHWLREKESLLAQHRLVITRIQDMLVHFNAQEESCT